MMTRRTSNAAIGRSALLSAFRSAIHCAFALSLGALLWLGSQSDAAQNNQDVRTLEPDKPIERELAGGQSHAYQVMLAAGQFLRVVVEQRGINVVVKLSGPDGKQIIEVDSPNGDQGPEPVSVVAETAGSYRLEARSLENDAKPGRYEIKVVEIRVATARDRSRLAAQKLITEAEALSGERTAAALRKVIEKYQEAIPLWRAAGDQAQEAISLNRIAQILYRFGEASKALAPLLEALPLARKAQDRAVESDVLHNLGAVYMNLGQPDKSLEYLDQALQLSRTRRDRRGEAGALDGIGSIYKVMGQLQKALDYHTQALPIREETGDQGGEGNTLNNIGSIYQSMGQSRKALEYYNRALPKRQAARDRGGEASTLNNIGRAYDDLGEHETARGYFNKLLALSRDAGDKSTEAYAINNLGGVYISLGEMQEAINHFSQARAIFHDLGDRRAEGYTLGNLGGVYLLLWEPEKALEYQTQSLKLVQEVKDKIGEMTAINNLGNIYDKMEDWQKALDHYNQALAMARELKDRRSEASVLSNLGGIYPYLGDKQKALGYVEQALSLFQTADNRRAEAEILPALGTLYLLLGEQQKAFDQYRRGLALAREIKNPGPEAASLQGLAEIARDRGNLDEAKAQVESAVKILESLRTKIIGQESRASYFALKQRYYQLYIDVLMRLHQRSPDSQYNLTALQISERARARGLVELLAEARVDIRQGVDPGLLKRERSLQQQITAATNRQIRHLSGPYASGKVEDETQNLASLTTEYQEVQTQIRGASPRYAALKQPDPLTPAQIQQLLDADTLLLEYSLGKDRRLESSPGKERSYLWAVSINSIGSYELPKGAQVEEIVKKLRAALTAPREAGITRAQRKRNAELDAKTRAAAAELSQMLLAPVAAQLGKKRLVIVADGALQYVPFAVLPKPGVAVQARGAKSSRNNRGAPLIPLVIDHEIVSLPSASTIAILRRELAGRQGAPKVFAALADPVFSEDQADERLNEAARATQRLASAQPKPATILPSSQDRAVRALLSAGAGDSEQRLRLPRLRRSREEALSIAEFAPGMSKVALGFEANYAAATSPELAEYRHVLFATHGWLDDKHPELTGILLSLVDEQKREQNGLLRLGEVYNLKLQADLVTLSACQTALGKDVRGEGLVGLTRGFMYAGAARVVASLWKVEEEGTKELMIRFYRGMLKRGLRPAAALRQAQISMLREPEWRSPYYWSAFILQGEWR